jgi:predicted transcriptional regulator
MSPPSKRVEGDVIRDFLAVANRLREPQLAQLYAHLVREGEATAQELTDALDLRLETADTYTTRLVGAGVVKATTNDQPHQYVAREIGLTVTATESTRE